jgi:hypothetical protein
MSAADRQQARYFDELLGCHRAELERRIDGLSAQVSMMDRIGDDARVSRRTQRTIRALKRDVRRIDGLRDALRLRLEILSIGAWFDMACCGYKRLTSTKRNPAMRLTAPTTCTATSAMGNADAHRDVFASRHLSFLAATYLGQNIDLGNANYPQRAVAGDVNIKANIVARPRSLARKESAIKRVVEAVQPS